MKPETKNYIHQARIAAVQDYIRKYYDEELRLSKLAALANLAPTTLCHIFKNEAKCTVSDYISKVRIHKAAEMLLNTDKIVRLIAFECGYSTLTNFNRQFKKYMGCTPTEYRERKK